MVNLIAKDFSDNQSSTRKFHIHDMFDYLIDKYDYQYYSIHEFYKDNINELLIEEFGELPKNIIVLKGGTSIIDFKTDLSIKISMIIDDIHHGGNMRKLRDKSLKYKINYVFATYAYFFHFYYKKYKYNLYWMPHSVRFSNIDLVKKPMEKILVSGRLNDLIYPNRKLILGLKHPRVKYFKPDVGYRYKEKKDVENKTFGRKYIKFLSRHLCCFTCDANEKRPYIVAKHFEILSSGSLLLSCNPFTKNVFKDLGFEDMIHYISCTPDNILQKIEMILNPENRNMINKIRQTGQSLAIKQHYYHDRGEFINQVLSGEIDDDRYGQYIKFDG